MKTGKKFWRLLGDYEQLARDEAVALREVNLAALAKLQSQKSAVGQAVLDSAAESGVNLPPERLERLVAVQKGNLALAQEQLARISCEQQNLAAAGQRLTQVGRAYKQESGGVGAFAAEG